MTVKYFTGGTLDAHKTKTKSNGTTIAYVEGVEAARNGGTALTAFWYPETAPLNNQDGTDAKGQGKGSKWDRIKAKVHSTTALAMKGGKARGTYCIGKYELGKMWKYRKTLKKQFSAAGFAVGGAVGERNMYTSKGNGNTGSTAKTKTALNGIVPLADSYELFPIDAGK
jgi:hypothetical protein